jgi:hypothetical protein
MVNSCSRFERHCFAREMTDGEMESLIDRLGEKSAR